MLHYRKILARFLFFFGQRIIFARGSVKNFICRSITDILDYNDSKNIEDCKIEARVNKVPMNFYFDRKTDVKIAFGNYNKKELQFIKSNLSKNAVFIDIGSNVGFYSQNIAYHQNSNLSKIVAIEANPSMANRHRENISLLEKIMPNISKKISLENLAVGEESKTMYLDQTHGYGPSFITEEENSLTIEVQMMPLQNILKKNNIKYITCLKIDIEGYEDRALLPFLENSNSELFPKHIVIEHTSSNEWSNKNLLNILLEMGYSEILRTRGNTCLSLRL